MIKKINKKGTSVTVLIFVLVLMMVLFLVVFTIFYFVDLSQDMEIEVRNIDRHSNEMALNALLNMESDGETLRRKIVKYIEKSEQGDYLGARELESDIEGMVNRFNNKQAGEYELQLRYDNDRYFSSSAIQPEDKLASTAILSQGQKVGKIILITEGDN